MEKNGSPSDFDRAVEWARREINSDAYRNIGVGFQITDPATGVSKMAYSDAVGRLGTSFIDVAIAPAAKSRPTEYSASCLSEFETLATYMLQNPSLFVSKTEDGLDDCVSLSDYSL